MFSFFKKKDQELQTSASRVAHPGEHTAAQKTAAEMPVFGRDDNSLLGIEVSNGQSSLSAAEEQAVILHANGDCAGALEALLGELPQIKGLRNLEFWLMLFELYQQTCNRAAFESLGMEFVAEFEKTPPIWREQTSAPGKRAQTGENTCSFGARLTAEAASGELERFRAVVNQPELLRLDFGKVAEIDLFAVIELLGLWQLTKRHAKPLQILGASAFIQLVSGKIQTGRNIPAEAPFWLLLMEIYQSLGQLEAFENLAIEYAITFEVSPPSWDVRLAPKTPPSKVDIEETSQTMPAEVDELVLHGAIASGHSQGLSEIRDYLDQCGGKAVLNFQHVDRVDFESAGQFLNVFMAGLQQGKSIRLVQVNELVLGLLCIMGVTELVTVERRKA